MNSAEKAAKAREQAMSSEIVDKFHEAQAYHGEYLEVFNRREQLVEKFGIRRGLWLDASCAAKLKAVDRELEKASKGLNKAIKLYTYCAERGHSDSMECLAFIYQDIIKDMKKSFKWYKLGAEAGNTTCMHNLGVCYQDGTGTKMSYTLAQYWFNREQEES